MSSGNRMSLLELREVQLAAGTAYLKVDLAGFDEQHVLRLISKE